MPLNYSATSTTHLSNNVSYSSGLGSSSDSSNASNTTSSPSMNNLAAAQRPCGLQPLRSFNTTDNYTQNSPKHIGMCLLTLSITVSSFSSLSLRYCFFFFLSFSVTFHIFFPYFFPRFLFSPLFLPYSLLSLWLRIFMPVNPWNKY